MVTQRALQGAQHERSTSILAAVQARRRDRQMRDTEMWARRRQQQQLQALQREQEAARRFDSTSAPLQSQVQCKSRSAASIRLAPGCSCAVLGQQQTDAGFLCCPAASL